MATFSRRLAPAALAAARLSTLVALVLACRSDEEPAPRVATFVQGTAGDGAALEVAGTAVSARGGLLRLLDDGTTVALATEDDVRAHVPRGAVVAVRGEVAATGGAHAASELLVRSVLRGPLQGRGDSTLAVAGADVDVDAATAVLDAGGAPTTLAGLPGGGRVEVSGWPAPGGRVRATLVRALPGAPAVVVHAWTRAAAAGGAFELSLLPGGVAFLRVDASAAGGDVAPPANALVRVAGSAIAGGAPPTLVAASVAVVSQILPFPGDRAVVEGIVTGGTATELVVGEHLVATTAATAFDGGPAPATATAALGPGVRLVAEGPFDGQRIVAERIRLVGLVRLAGRIVPGSFALGNPATSAEWTVAGTSVLADARTRVAGVGGEALSLAELAALHGAELAGLPVAVLGYARADGTLQAHRVDVTGG